ncbi:MAG TPA: MFS transporter [Marmoricola sp.]|nr:MFS transporter [Marmoricola sp.]
MRVPFGSRLAGRLRAQVGGPARLRVVVLLALVLALDSADKATVGAVAAQLESRLHIDNTQIGLLVSIPTLMAVLATLPVGMLTDRVNRVRLLGVAIVLWSAAMLASGAAPSYTVLLVTRLGLGAVAAAATPAVASLTGDLFPAAERGRIFGFILSGELVGAGLGFVVSGDVAGWLSWRWAFWWLAVPGVALAYALVRLLPEPARGGQSRLLAGAENLSAAVDPAREDAGEQRAIEAGEQPAQDEDVVQAQVEESDVQPHAHLVLREDPTDRNLWWAVRYVLSIRTNRVLILASAFGYFFFTGLRTFAVVFVRGRFGVGQSAASSLLFLVGLGAVAGVLVSGRLADRLVGRGHLVARPVVAGVCYLAAAALFVPGLLVPAFFAAAPVLFLAAAGLGGANPPLDSARLDLVHFRLWGRAESVRTVLRTGLEALAPLTFGYVSTLFGGEGASFGEPSSSGPAIGTALQETFLVMLVPLVAAGLLLSLRARQTYARDVATASASNAATPDPKAA